MDEIEYGIRIPVDDSDDAITLLETLLQEDVIEELRVETESIYMIETADDRFGAEYAALPRYPNDLDQQRGLNITSSFKYNSSYEQGEFKGIARNFEHLDELRETIEEATSFDVTSYIDRVTT